MNRIIESEALLRQLRWRYATKQFHADRVIAAADWNTLSEALALTPSSFGLQPWKFYILTDKATREKLVPACWNQRQVADCSHLVIFAHRLNVGTAEIDAWLKRIVEVRKVPSETLGGYRAAMVNHLVQGPLKTEVDEYARRQCYIALGNFMTCASLLGIDTCPMEGFETDKLEAILKLEPRGYRASVLCAAGYRAAGDHYAKAPKVRYATSDIVQVWKETE